MKERPHHGQRRKRDGQPFDARRAAPRGFRRAPQSSSPAGTAPRHGLARILSKLGYCSRSQAVQLITNGRVRVNGTLRLDPEYPVIMSRDTIEVDGAAVRPARKVYLVLNKPRGLITTAADEQGRTTVFSCLTQFRVPHLCAVGRLDKASEGLLLFTNDTSWADGITDPANHVRKIYHVQVDRVADDPLLARIRAGVISEGEHLTLLSVALLRTGDRNSWLEIALEEGRNRHIRRLLAALEIGVLRLVRVAIGPLELGQLQKGQARALTEAEIAALRLSKLF